LRRAGLSPIPVAGTGEGICRSKAIAQIIEQERAFVVDHFDEDAAFAIGSHVREAARAPRRLSERQDDNMSAAAVATALGLDVTKYALPD